MTVERMSIPLHSAYSSRDRGTPTSSKDGYLYNAYIDKSANGELYVTRRPALVYDFGNSASAANGIFWWEKLQTLLHDYGA